MSVSTLQTIKREKLGCIKGLGVKRVEAIIHYRKNHHLNRLEELLNIQGIGKVLLKNIREDKEKKVCTNFDRLSKRRENRKKDIKAE